MIKLLRRFSRGHLTAQSPIWVSKLLHLVRSRYIWFHQSYVFIQVCGSGVPAVPIVSVLDFVYVWSETLGKLFQQQYSRCRDFRTLVIRLQSTYVIPVSYVESVLLLIHLPVRIIQNRSCADERCLCTWRWMAPLSQFRIGKSQDPNDKNGDLSSNYQLVWYSNAKRPADLF